MPRRPPSWPFHWALARALPWILWVDGSDCLVPPAGSRGLWVGPELFFPLSCGRLLPRVHRQLVEVGERLPAAPPPGARAAGFPQRPTPQGKPRFPSTLLSPFSLPCVPDGLISPPRRPVPSISHMFFHSAPL